jgi:hypothetical protein
MLHGCRKADRAEDVERDRFATPNSLKSHGERNLFSPFSNPCAITPKLCMPSRPIHPSKNITRHSNHVPRLNLHSARGTAGAPLPAISCFGGRPKTSTVQYSIGRRGATGPGPRIAHLCHVRFCAGSDTAGARHNTGTQFRNIGLAHLSGHRHREHAVLAGWRQVGQMRFYAGLLCRP